MIKFGETIEEQSGKELPPLLTYKDIAPKSRLSIAESKQFWNTLFCEKGEAQHVEPVDEEWFLSEIFGRDESDFTFDFNVHDESIQSCLMRFDDTHWNSLTEAQKRDLICEFGETLARKLGLEEVPEIDFVKKAELSCGSFKQRYNSIEINTNIFCDPKEVIDTVAHEMRHAYQYQRANILETREDLLYKANFDNYVSPIPLGDGKYLFFIDYQDQLVEAEARAFAKLFSE